MTTLIHPTPVPTPGNPVEPFLRSDRMPHIWCPGCGIGTTVNCFAEALIDSKIDLKTLALVSGIGCTGRVAGYVKLDSFHTTHGRAIPFATGLKLANPNLNVVVYSGDGDLSAIGGNHLIHAARRNVDLKVICVNNLIYAMTGGQTAPTTPGHATICWVANLHPRLPKTAHGAATVPRYRATHTRAGRIPALPLPPTAATAELPVPVRLTGAAYTRLTQGEPLARMAISAPRAKPVTRLAIVWGARQCPLTMATPAPSTLATRSREPYRTLQ